MFRRLYDAGAAWLSMTGVELVDVRDQRDLFQERGQAMVLTRFGKGIRRGYELYASLLG